LVTIVPGSKVKRKFGSIEPDFLFTLCFLKFGIDCFEYEIKKMTVWFQN